MKKLNWQIEFLTLVRERESDAFEWGVNDCVLFAADCVVLMGNEDPAKASRGKYKTELGAKRHLVSVYGSLEQAWDSKHERLENINFVQNGDVVLYESILGATSGIYWNGGVYAPTLEGVRYIDEQHKKLTSVWRI